MSHIQIFRSRTNLAVNSINFTLQQHFGFTTFRTGQQESIESILHGRHTLVVMPTGAGKSLIYQFAAIHTGRLTLVISPLVALMSDQVSALHKLNTPATYINSTVPAVQQRRRLEKMASGEYKLVYVAPERFRNRSFRKVLEQVDVGLLAIDEAHCISKWGHDFRPDYRRIAQARSLMGNPLTIALTATATPQVQDDIARSLGLEMRRIVTGFNRPNLILRVLRTRGRKAKQNALRELLKSVFNKDSSGRVLIYTGTRSNAEEVAAFVRDVVQLPVAHYHAGLEDEVRQSVQESFLTGELRIVAATNAFGMGIDRSDVRLVVHYQIPGSLEAYYQEAGRAGRDGEPAAAVLLYDPADRSLHEYFIQSSLPSYQELRTLYETVAAHKHRSARTSVLTLARQSSVSLRTVRVALEQLELAGAIHRQDHNGQELHIKVGRWDDDAVQRRQKQLEVYKEHQREQLQKMISYAGASDCRRRRILRHFDDRGQISVKRCCDNCLKTAKQEKAAPRSGSTAEDLILACVHDFPGQLSRSGVAKVLVGSTSSRVDAYRTSRLYGKLHGRSRKRVTALVDELIDKGLLILDGRRVKLTRQTMARKAAPLLRGPWTVEQIVSWGKKREKGRVPDLIAALSDERYNVRRLAASALGKIADVRAVIPLMDLLNREEAPQIRQYAVKALGKIGDHRVTPLLAQIASNQSEMYYTRDAAKSALKRLRGRRRR